MKNDDLSTNLKDSGGGGGGEYTICISSEEAAVLLNSPLQFPSIREWNNQQ